MSDNTLYVDCDNTLVFPASAFPGMAEDNLPVLSIYGRNFYVNTNLVETIKDFDARGLKVVIWSSGGEAWATAIVLRLGLGEFVHAVLSKPTWIFDDKQPAEWMPIATFVAPPARQADVLSVTLPEIRASIRKHSWGNFNMDELTFEEELRGKAKSHPSSSTREV